MLMLTGFAVFAWLALLTARGGFWRADQRLSAAPQAQDSWPEVVAIIPARDEAPTIAEVLRSHAATGYPGHFSVIVVDDASRDGTAEIARRVAEDAARPIRVVPSRALPAGWTGKLWALETGLRSLEATAPGAELILLTDADIRHAPETLERLLARMREGNCDLVSLMARLDARGFWGGMLVPAFVFFFQKLYPFRWVNDSTRSAAGAAGGCILIRRAALERIGGFSDIRGELIDDCALARAVKHGPGGGGRIWLGLASDEVVSMRDNRSFGAIWGMVTRTAFTQLGHSTPILIGALAGMFVIYLAGPIAVLGFSWHGDPRAAALGAVAWMLSGLAYLPTLRLYGKPPWQALALPVAAAIYSVMTLASAIAHWRGRGGQWKGRSY